MTYLLKTISFSIASIFGEKSYSSPKSTFVLQRLQEMTSISKSHCNTTDLSLPPASPVNWQIILEDFEQKNL